MIYLLGVVVVATRCRSGRRCSRRSPQRGRVRLPVRPAVLHVRVSDPHHVVTFAVMLVVGLRGQPAHPPGQGPGGSGARARAAHARALRDEPRSRGRCAASEIAARRGPSPADVLDAGGVSCPRRGRRRSDAPGRRPLRAGNGRSPSGSSATASPRATGPTRSPAVGICLRARRVPARWSAGCARSRRWGREMQRSRELETFAAAKRARARAGLARGGVRARRGWAETERPARARCPPCPTISAPRSRRSPAPPSRSSRESRARAPTTARPARDHPRGGSVSIGS